MTSAISVTDGIELSDGYTWRPMTVADLPAAQDLLDACEAAVTGERRPHQIDVGADARQPRVDMARDQLLIMAPNGALAAFGWVYPFDSGNAMCEPNVHPDHPRELLEEPLLVALERRAAQRARAVGATSARLSVWCEDGETRRRDLLLGRAYAKVRDTHVMRIRLSEDATRVAALPPGIDARPFRRPVDLRALHAAVEEAFAEHFNFEPTTFDDFSAWATTEVEPERWLVAWDGGEIAGEVLALRREHDMWIESVSVRKPWRGRGLALALLQRQFATLHGAGFDDVFLGVDAENATGAVQLYERAGMHIWRRFWVFERTV